MAIKNSIHWMWSSRWFKEDMQIARIRLEELRKGLRFHLGYVLGMSEEGLSGGSQLHVVNYGGQIAGILDWDGTSDMAWGYDALDLFGVSMKEGKLRIVTYRLVPERETAVRLCLSVNEQGMTKEGFMGETISLSAVMMVMDDRYLGDPIALFTDCIVPALRTDTNYECVTDYPRRLDEADRYGAIAVEHLFPTLMEDAKGDVKRLTELSMLLNHAIAVAYRTSDVEMVHVYDKLWLEVDNYAATQLSDKEYGYYYQITD